MNLILKRRTSIGQFILYALVALCATAACVSSVHAAGLGKMKVLSALGAPFKAEIELTNLRPEDDVNLIARIATVEVFKQAGIDYNPALASIRATVLKDSNPATIVLTSSSTVNEPLLEVLLELSWQSGRLIRQYTVLLDPITPVADAPSKADEPLLAAPQLSAQPAPTPAPGASEPAAPAASAASPNKPEAAKDTASNKTYDVKTGDTLYGIASRMNNGDNAQIKALMALLLKNNPQAFIGNNMNKLKAGVVLNTGATALGGSALADKSNHANNANTAPSKAFSQYKQSAARKVKALAANNDDSKAISSAVSTKAKPVAQASEQDQLKVAGNAALGNKSLTAAGKSAEEKIAKDRAIADEKSRVAQLQKNIQKSVELKNSTLASATAPVADKTAPATAPAAPQASTAATASVIAAPAASDVKPTTVPAAGTSEATVAQLNKPAEPVKPANPVAAKAVAPVVVDEPSWYEGIDPLTVGGLGGAALLGGLLWYRRRQAKAASGDFADTAFNPKDTQGTLLTEDGGQAVDTFNSVFVSSFEDNNGAMESAEVDPVAEADVYMQYGRDAHAEDILKDALKQNPNRHPVRLKLMELYASKQNASALKGQFDTLTELTNGAGSEWIAGKQIMAATDSVTSIQMAPASLGRTSTIASLIKTSETVNTALPHINLADPTMIGDVQLSNPTVIDAPPQRVSSASTASLPTINLATTIMKDPTPETKTDIKTDDKTDLKKESDALSFDIQSPTMFVSPNTVPATPALPAVQTPSTALDFKMTKATLNPPSIFDKISGEGTTSTVQALETKFSLAQAYMDIGDKEGAKELLQEVVESGHQHLTEQAQALLLKL